MPQVVIENPILNSPFREPSRHFRFDETGITNEVVEGRRTSCYFVPIPAARKKTKQADLFTEWTEDRIQPNELINSIRSRVDVWRAKGRPYLTRTSRRLLEYWTRPDRGRPLFFCQIEALETVMFLAEAASRSGEAWIETELRRLNDDANPGLFRIALKMATGTGKTVVMAMLIAWQTLNRIENPHDRRFSDAFLVITPGVTIRDRLRVLLPNEPDNYYRERDVVGEDDARRLLSAKFVITNFHAFLQRETGDAAKLTKSILGGAQTGAFTETPDQMVRRVCRAFGAKKGIVVLNDEAHHCYRRRAGGEDAELSADDRREAKKRDDEARVWISGVEAVQRKLGIRAVYDLSATPFFLRGSGWGETKLFPWVVSDFSLIDAIESGIVKVPRVPVADDSMTGDAPTYRDIWPRIREALPRKGRKTGPLTGEPVLPPELQGALKSLYSNYEKYFAKWQERAASEPDKAHTPPVFIIVCNNTNVSKLVYDHVAGWERTLDDGSTVVVPGSLALFSNERDRKWAARPNTILVDSGQLESGEGMSADFKKIAAAEIEEFRNEMRRRFPGRDVSEITDEEILREVMNTVGKPGKLGEHVRCVVSVSMLTEGWDANTVTHVLGVRAFGTQILCEQVVGRALRRRSYVPDAEGMFTPEYAEVYGVPFSFIPSAGSEKEPEPRDPPTRVRALPARAACAITFPRVTGYRFELPEDRLAATFDASSKLVLSTRDVPTRTEVAPIVGEAAEHYTDWRDTRAASVEFDLAKHTLEQYFSDPAGAPRPWLFPQVLAITRRWMRECLVLHDNAYPQMLRLHRHRDEAAKKIHLAVARHHDTRPRLRPILRPYDTVGSTEFVDFDTTRPTWRTRADKCHVSHVVADTDSWEQKTAQSIEDMPEVVRYVKNHNLGFTIPYTIDGAERQYTPDFVVHIDDGAGPQDPLRLLVEVSGEARRDKAEKVATARDLWVPAVNNQGDFGRWAFLEVADPWNVQSLIRGLLVERRKSGLAPAAIQRTPGVCGGDACVRSTRIPVWLLVSWRDLGRDYAWILRNYPGLTAGDLEAAWAYAGSHADEIARAAREHDEA
ncbi:MAG: DUF433 domain-containing protein [Planctomycetes bacterium]|nr:DUF433 domain-containing protein [Planctomycetota bacterium]